MLYCNNRINTYDITSVYGYIYKIALPDGRYYIGQKKGLPEKSKNYFGSGTHINNWFLKNIGYSSKNCPYELTKDYGIEKEILDYALDEIELDCEEVMWIKCYRENQEFKGQCLNLNGGGSVCYISTEESKKRREEKMRKYYDDPNGYYKNHEWQWKQNLPKMWEAAKNRVWTEEERKRHSERLKGTKVKDTFNMKLAQKGSKNPSAKLNEDKVREIRLYFKENNINKLKGKDANLLGTKYGVSEATIRGIFKGITWTHVKV